MYHWDDNPDLNITPLVDVMLVLMAILMITAPTITFEEKIQLPIGSKSQKVSKNKNITIRMDINKKIYLNKDTYQLDTFADDFRNQSFKMNKNIEIYIRADENLKYKYVIYLLKTIKISGFQKVSLITL